MVMVNEEGQHWGEISHWRISHALRYWFGWALAIVGQVGWVSAILRFEWWAWRYGSLCVVFFLQFPFGLVLPMDPEICSQYVCGMAEACRMPECFTTCCRYVSKNGNVLVKGDQQTLRFSLCSSDAGPPQARCSLPGKVAGCWCGRWGPITNQRLLDLLPAHQPSISTWCALAEVDPPRNKYSGQGRQL